LSNGYAKQHPELIGAFVQTSAIDLGTAVIALPSARTSMASSKQPAATIRCKLKR
jgi:hypothetical protein